MKATQQYFPLVLFTIMMYKANHDQKCDHWS